MESPVPAAILAAFPIGAVSSVEVVTHGLIHATYKVEAEKGTFIMQRLHPVLSAAEIAADFLAVTDYLNEKGFPSPRCVKSKAGSVLVQDEEGKPWRLQTFLSGGQTFHTVQDTAMARDVGDFLARFHLVLQDMPYTFQTKRVAHATETIYAQFMEAVENHPELAAEVPDEVAFIRDELPKLFLPDDLPTRKVHGDPKISNFLFNGKRQPFALIDLDTGNQMRFILELGEMFKYWCGEEEDKLDNAFRLDFFEASYRAYVARAGALVSPQEKALLPQAIRMLTLELASRFLADYFNDSYFGWDAARYPSRRAHNLARTRGQIALYKDLMGKMKEVKGIIGVS